MSNTSNLSTGIAYFGICPGLHQSVGFGCTPLCEHFRFNCPACITESRVSRCPPRKTIEAINDRCFVCLVTGRTDPDPFLFDVDYPQDPYISNSERLGYQDSKNRIQPTVFSADAPVWALMAADPRGFFVKMRDAYGAGYDRCSRKKRR